MDIDKHTPLKKTSTPAIIAESTATIRGQTHAGSLLYRLQEGLEIVLAQYTGCMERASTTFPSDPSKDPSDKSCHGNRS